ncbi:MAG: fucose isomerase, partial [Blautia sp.]|nr:fucose isomerase [Blautia sp.]
MNLSNMPELKLGIVAVSRDCFPMSLSENRRKAVVEAYKNNFKGEIFECPTVVESETDMLKAAKELREAGCNAQIVYLGNFGPETEETMLVKAFHGPSMVVAAAEEGNLVQGRGDAYCGMLNASYNLKLRNLNAYIPEYP